MNDTKGPVVGLGELLWDCFGDQRRAGGAPANVAYSAGQIGLRGVVVSRVGQDEDGDELLRRLSDRGLNTQYVQRDAGHPTGRVTVDESDPNAPRYEIHENVAWDYLEMSPQLGELASRAAAVAFGTLAQRSENSQRTIHAFLDATGDGCLCVYDVNLRPPHYDQKTIERSLHVADVVKLNGGEVEELSQVLDLGLPNTKSFARTLQDAFGVEMICVTRGSEGCLIIDREGEVEAAAEKVEVADAVGAGDAFTAGMIAARLAGRPLHDVARLANRVAAHVASKAGAMVDFDEQIVRMFAD